MAQNATYASAVDNLFSYNPKSFVRSNDSQKSEKIVNEIAEAVDFVKSSTALVYNNRVRLNINLDSSLKDFVLLKGLIEFHRSGSFLFSYDRGEKRIEADFQESEFATFKEFLRNVVSWLRSERKFRSALKNVIEFEAKYKAEKELLYSALGK